MTNETKKVAVFCQFSLIIWQNSITDFVLSRWKSYLKVIIVFIDFQNALKAQKQIIKTFFLNYISSDIRSGTDFSGILLIVQLNVFYNCLL